MAEKKVNNLQTFVDKIPHVDTVSIVFGVRSGSRNENEVNNGVSHFLEHMAFKGTETRDYVTLAKEIDNVGGHINAYTSKERTIYYVKLMKEDLKLGIDIISDIVQNSTFPEEEIEKERGVILQELSATLDTPDDVVFDYFYEAAFPKTTLGRTILGPAEIIKSLQKKDFQDYIGSRYSAQNSCLSISGNIDESNAFDLTERFFNKLPNFDIKEDEKAHYTGSGFIKHNENLEQVQCLIGFESKNYNSDDIYTLGVLSSILGSGMSSRLFQEIREKRGLVYTVSCFNDSYNDTGIFAIYAGTSPEKVDEFLHAARDELVKICDNITDEEMQRVLKQTKSGIAMSNESTNARAQKACTDYLHFGRFIDYKEIMEKIERITKNDIKRIAEEIFRSNSTLAIYGNTAEIKTDYQKFSEIIKF